MIFTIRNMSHVITTKKNEALQLNNEYLKNPKLSLFEAAEACEHMSDVDYIDMFDGALRQLGMTQRKIKRFKDNAFVVDSGNPILLLFNLMSDIAHEYINNGGCDQYFINSSEAAFELSVQFRNERCVAALKALHYIN